MIREDRDAYEKRRNGLEPDDGLYRLWSSRAKCTPSSRSTTTGMYMGYLPVEDHGIIGDCHTAALVGTDGSIDWLCLPRFDAASVFGALLGDAEQGRWSLRPVDAAATATRAYRPDTFTLVTRWVTADGSGEVEVTELMPR